MPEALVALNYGFDAVATWIHGFDSADRPSRVSRGLYGVDVGLPRVLDVHQEYDIPGTFFVPGYNVESFPDSVERIVRDGHELQCHGWKHTAPTEMTCEEERADIERAVAAIEDVAGRRPDGYRAPTGDFSDDTLDLLQEFGFEFDSSLQGDDFSPYMLREGREANPDRGTFDRGTETDIVEIPFDWSLTEFIPFTHIWSDPHRRGYGDETVYFDRWRKMFDWMYANEDCGVFVTILHPQLCGRIPLLTEFQAFLEYVIDRPGVEFTTMSAVAEAYRGGEL